MEIINIWDFPYEVSVLLEKTFFKDISYRLKQKYKYLRKVYTTLKPQITFLSFKSMLKPSYRNFRSLKLILTICEDLNVDLNTLQKHILAYRTTKGRTFISQPKLPVEITPLFDMVIAHIFGDGCCIKIKGREKYFCYTQTDDTLRLLFLQKVESIFGKVKYPKEYFKKLKRIYVPSILSTVLSGHYSLSAENFLENNVTIPTGMLNKQKNYLLAVLVAFIIDEGNIDSGQIVIPLQNKRLISDLGAICKKLNYPHSISKTSQKRCVLYILSNGVKKFWYDYMLLKKEYPEVFMGYKEDQIKDFILRKEKILRGGGENSTKNAIIKLLKEKPRKISELSKILLISRQGIRFHIKTLKKMGVIKRKIISRGKRGGDTYALVKFVELPEKRRGLSKQEGVTKTNILNFLKKEKLGAKDLAQKLKIDSNTVRNFLYKLEKEGKVKKACKEKVDQKHYKMLWTLTTNL